MASQRQILPPLYSINYQRLTVWPHALHMMKIVHENCQRVFLIDHAHSIEKDVTLNNCMS
jgi:hypothetical protein